MQNLYAIYDADMDEFSPPYILKNDNVAVKTFKADLAEVCYRHVRQHQNIDVSIYSIYHVGYFDPESEENPVVGIKPRFIYCGGEFDTAEYQAEIDALKAEDEEVNNG